MEVTVQREIKYIPDWNDNKKDAKPIKVKLHFLTPGERDSCFEWKDGDLIPNRVKFFHFGVIEFEDLKVNDKNIKTAEDVLNTPGLEGLYNEVCAKIIRQNARQDLKNS